MKRIDIYYGGDHYSVGGRRIEDLRAEIEAGLKAGTYWLEVNDGEGAMRSGSPAAVSRRSAGGRSGARRGSRTLSGRRVVRRPSPGDRLNGWTPSRMLPPR